MANDAVLDRAFAACSHPIRRGILERLGDGGELSVAEATSDFGVSKPAISRHLKVLEEAGAIVRVIDGRTHRLRVPHDSMQDAHAWMTRQRELWERKLDVVDSYLRERRAEDRRDARSDRSEKPRPREERS